MPEAPNCNFYKAMLVVLVLLLTVTITIGYRWSNSRVVDLLDNVAVLQQRADEWKKTSDSLRQEVEMWKGTSAKLRAEADAFKADATQTAKALDDLRNRLGAVKDCNLPSLGGIFKK